MKSRIFKRYGFWWAVCPQGTGPHWPVPSSQGDRLGADTWQEAMDWLEDHLRRYHNP